MALEFVVETHGRYQVVQGTSGCEIREDAASRRRGRIFVGGILFGMAAIAYSEGVYPVAAMTGAAALVVLLRAVSSGGRSLLIDEGEIRIGRLGDLSERRGAWPKSQVAKVVIEQLGVEPRMVERGRRPGPFYAVRIVGRDGTAHAARFRLRSKETAHGLAKAIADRIGVSVEMTGGGGAAPRAKPA